MENFIIPAEINVVLEKIEDLGYEAWLVGGCVRDMLRGCMPHDYDIASSVPCEAVCAAFDRVIETGLKHGTVTVISDGVPIEVTRYRVDGSYSDGRHPDSVSFTGSFAADLSRRDFTVNAIGYHPIRGLYDPFGGKNDLSRGVLRTVGEPERRFGEDALRIMRAVRFASTLGFSIEQETLDAAIRLAPTLQNVSAERIFSELKKALAGTRPSLLEVLIASGGLRHIGLCECKPLSSLDRIDGSVNIRLAALIRLCNADAAAVCASLKTDRAARATVKKAAAAIAADPPLDSVGLKRLLAELSYDELIGLLSALSVLNRRDTTVARRTIDRIVEQHEPYRIGDLAINGDDLETLGITGRAAGDTLEMLLGKVLCDPSLNTPGKLKLLVNMH